VAKDAAADSSMAMSGTPTNECISTLSLDAADTVTDRVPFAGVDAGTLRQKSGNFGQAGSRADTKAASPEQWTVEKIVWVINFNILVILKIVNFNRKPLIIGN